MSIATVSETATVTPMERELIEAHANDILRGDMVDLIHAIKVSTERTERVLPIDVNELSDGTMAEVVSKSFRKNRTRLRLNLDGVLFNLFFLDDEILLILETEKDKLDREASNEN